MLELRTQENISMSKYEYLKKTIKDHWLFRQQKKILFVQWDISEHNASRSLISLCMLGLSSWNAPFWKLELSYWVLITLLTWSCKEKETPSLLPRCSISLNWGTRHMTVATLDFHPQMSFPINANIWFTPS